MQSFTQLLAVQGVSGVDAMRRLRAINGYVKPWRETGDAIQADKK
jgi:hypothetical protein